MPTCLPGTFAFDLFQHAFDKVNVAELRVRAEPPDQGCGPGLIEIPHYGRALAKISRMLRRGGSWPGDGETRAAAV